VLRITVGDFEFAARLEEERAPNTVAALRRLLPLESTLVQARVVAARIRQLDRQGKSNAALATKEIDRWCAPDAAAATLLSAALVRLKLSARAYHRVLKLARTVADLAGSETIASAHVAEAIHYRRNLGDN